MQGRRRLARDTSATAQAIAFLTAGAIFLGAVASILAVSRNANVSHSAADQASQSLQAGGLADILVGSPGIGWSAGADHISRLGLESANGSGLDPASLDALRGATAASQADGKVDYVDALASLGLPTDGRAGFHLRVYPVGLSGLYNQSLAGLRVGYIGDWTSLASVSVASTMAQSQMAAQANAQLNLSMAANTVLERQALRALGVVFNDRIYITTATPTILVDYPSPLPDLPLLTVLNVPLLEGDVYPDSKSYLDTVMAGRLSRYDVLIVGSGVDHSTLTSGTLKNAVRDWVLGGGNLIVFGSDDKATGWLSTLLSAGVSNVNGAPTAPDATHPLLSDPYDLAWTSYDSHGQGWDLAAAGQTVYDEFSHVVIQGGLDVLAVSHTSSFGSGQILLTTWRGRDVSASLGQVELQHMLTNFLVYADRSDLYLDYGGTVPADLPVALAVRQSYLWDPVVGQVPVRVEVLAWS